MASHIVVRLLKRVFVSWFLLLLGVVVVIPPTLMVLWRVITRPMAAFSKKKRVNPPAAYLDPLLGRHECANVNGIQLYYVSAGDKEKPLMLFLHGFPECWYSWRYQLKFQEFRENFHMVAVDLRGFGRSSKPSYFHLAYHPDNLVEDIKQLIGALGYESCVLVAHDWGGNVAYRLSRMHPECVDKLVVMDIPEDRVFQSFARANFSQVKRSLYMAIFQVPFVPEFLLSIFDYGFIISAFRKKPAGVVNTERITDEDLEVFKWNIAQRRTLTAGLNYYRCIPSLVAPVVFGKRPVTKQFAMPVLLLWGESDSALDPAMAQHQADSGYFDDITVRLVSGASHWVQQDQPDVVNNAIMTWLQAKEGK